MTPELERAVTAIAQYFNKSVHWISTPKGPRPVREPLKKTHIKHHVNGGPKVGLAPIVPGTSTTCVAVLDLDDHKKKIPWEQVANAAQNIAIALRTHGLKPIPFRSSGGRGVHLIMLWDDEQDAYSVRELLREVLEACGYKSGAKGLEFSEIEIFPKQDEVPEDGIGNMTWLPLAGESMPLDPQTFRVLDYAYAETMVDWPLSEPVEPRVKPPRAEVVSEPSVEHAMLQKALEALPNEDLGYDDWFKVICGIHFETGGSAEGLALANAWSAKSAKHDPEFLEQRVWPYVKDDRGGNVITGQYVLAQARAHGFGDDVIAKFDDLGHTDDAVAQAGGSSLPQSATSSETTPPAATAPPLLSPADVTLEPLLDPQYLVKNWLEKRSNAVLFGKWNAGKTFVALDMAAHIATGTRWFGERVRAHGVLYLGYEGAVGMSKRMYALREKWPDEDWSKVPLGWSILRWPLLADEGRAELVAAITSFKQRWGKNPGLIIIDPLQNALGTDDSDPVAMQKLNSVVSGLIERIGCTVLRVHHSGHADQTRARGHSSLPAAVDTEIMVADNQISSSKQRDMAKLAAPFALRVVELGKDRDGDQVTTCVVEPVEVQHGGNGGIASGAPHFDAWPAPSGANMFKAWQTCRAQFMWETEIQLHDLIEKCVADQPVDPRVGQTNPNTNKPYKDRRPEDVRRSIDQLIMAGYLVQDGGPIGTVRIGPGPKRRTR